MFTEWSPALPSTMPAANQIHTAQWISSDEGGGGAGNGGGGRSVPRNIPRLSSAPPLEVITNFF